MMSECSSPALLPILSVVRKILSIIGIIAPILLLVMASVHLVNLVKNPDDKKAFPKLRNSFIAAVVVFFIPVIVNAVMYMLDDTFTVSDCWNKAEYSSKSTYQDPYGDKRKQIFVDPDEYNKGDKSSQQSNTSTSTIEGNAQQVGDVVWDTNDLNRISNLTSSQLIAILNREGGNAKNFIPYASGLITTEQKYHVNVFFLIGVEALESGWVTSSISQTCNNLGGVCESSAHPSNGCGGNSNCNFAYFSSVNEFIDYHGRMLHENYLTPGGAYYHGASPSGVVQSYCPGCDTWPSTVVSIANSLFSHVKDVI